MTFGLVVAAADAVPAAFDPVGGGGGVPVTFDPAALWTGAVEACAEKVRERAAGMPYPSRKREESFDPVIVTTNRTPSTEN